MYVQGDPPGITCHFRKEQGHYERDCPKHESNYQKKNNRRQSAKKAQGGGEGGTKWCSLHRSVTHSDAECKVQQQQQANNGSATVANMQHPCQYANAVNMPHPCQQAIADNVQQPCQHTNAVNVQQQCQHANFANVSHPCLFNNSALQHRQHTSSTGAAGASAGFQGGSSYMATTAAADDTVPTISFDKAPTKQLIMLGRDRPLDWPSAATVGLFGEPLDLASMAMIELYNNSGAITAGNILILVDNGASEHYVDGHITPGLRGRLSDYKALAVPRKITTAGNHKLPGDATGVISGTVIDTHGQRQSVGLSIVAVSGLGKKLFSIPEATSEGVVTVFALDGSRIETNGFSIPLQQVAGTRDPFLFNLEENVPNVASPAKADADTWHRRMGDNNGRYFELLN